MTASLLRNRLLLLVVALVAASNTASSFVSSWQRPFGSRSVPSIQPFSTDVLPNHRMQRRQSHHHPSSVFCSSPSPSSRLQVALYPHDLFLSHDTLILAQQQAQQEIARTSTNLLSAYSHLLQVHPISTKAITAAILACTGDAIAQWRSESAAYDPRRGAGFLLFGALYTGAFQHFWFNYMSQNIAHWGDVLGVWGPERVSYPVDSIFDVAAWWKYFDIVKSLELPPTPETLAAAKVALNQFVVIPTIYMPLFFAFTGLVSGLDSKESMARARSLYFPLLQRNWFYWLPMQFLQFLVIPVDFQIPFVSAASLVWTIILSSIGSGSAAPSAASSIVVYDTLQTQDGEFGAGQEIVTVANVDSGAANKITDDVLLEDVEKALFPEILREVVSDSRTQLATGGLATGLLAAAAEEGAIGAAVGQAMAGAQLGGGGGVESVGVAVVAAVGAGLGLLAASSSIKHNHADVNDMDAASAIELNLNDNDADAALSLNNSSMQHEIEAGIMLDRNDFAKPTSVDDAVVLEEEQDVAGSPLR